MSRSATRAPSQGPISRRAQGVMCARYRAEMEGGEFGSVGVVIVRSRVQARRLEGDCKVMMCFCSIAATVTRSAPRDLTECPPLPLWARSALPVGSWMMEVMLKGVKRWRRGSGSSSAIGAWDGIGSSLLPSSASSD